MSSTAFAIAVGNSQGEESLKNICPAWWNATGCCWVAPGFPWAAGCSLVVGWAETSKQLIADGGNHQASW